MDLATLIWLFGTAVVAGFVDSIAGGGGLITIPVLLSAGLSPVDALGTNKLQASFGSGTATWHYGRAGLINFRESTLGVICTAIGAVLGTLLVQRIDPRVLRWTIPWLLIAIALFMLFRPTVGEASIRPRMGAYAFYVTVGLTLGFYDGSFGPGTGTFWAMAYLLGRGFDLTRATAATKLMNFTSNIASLVVFTAGGHVFVTAGLVMGLGQLVGARLGARAVIKRGTRLIRPIFITVVLAITARLLYQNFWQ